MSVKNFLPYGRQLVDDDDVAAVVETLRGEFLTTGPLVGAYESAFAATVGAAQAVACNSGTAALHLALLAQDLTETDTVVVPSLTFVATANTVRFTGAETVFADVDAETGLMTAETFAAALERAKAGGRRVKAAMVVHLRGQVCDMPQIADIAKQHEVVLIEDACHALGVEGIGATRHSAAACFSTHPVKAITTGEGGVVVSHDVAATERMRRLRNHGISRVSESFKYRNRAFDGEAVNPWYYEMSEIGWNYRLPDILCALGISQLRKLEFFWRRRCALARYYDEALAPLAPALRPVPRNGAPHGWHLYGLLIDFGALRMSRRQFMEDLRASGIGTQVHYLPVHHQPYYRARYGEISLPGADAYYARCLTIPLSPAMSDSDAQRVVGALTTAVQKAAA
jgi:UDP-4-amino-4,6-dideoxy-N-acetyl-beta-L-altrosamine transaminase